MTTTRFAFDETAARAGLELAARLYETGEPAPEGASDDYRDFIELHDANDLNPVWNIHDSSEVDNLLYAAFGEKWVTGPAQPYLTVDDDSYVFGVKVGGSNGFHVTSDWEEVRRIVSIDPATDERLTGIPAALDLLGTMVMGLNGALSRLDAYVATQQPEARAAFEAGFDLATDHPLLSRKDFNARMGAWLVEAFPGRTETLAQAEQSTLTALAPDTAASLLAEFDSWSEDRAELSAQENEGPTPSSDSWHDSDDTGCDLAQRFAHLVRTTLTTEDEQPDAVIVADRTGWTVVNCEDNPDCDGADVDEDGHTFPHVGRVVEVLRNDTARMVGGSAMVVIEPGTTGQVLIVDAGIHQVAVKLDHDESEAVTVWIDPDNLTNKQAPPAPVVQVEVSPCAEELMSGEGQTEVVTPDRAEFWTVYLRHNEGNGFTPAYAHVDTTTQAEAETRARELATAHGVPALYVDAERTESLTA